MTDVGITLTVADARLKLYLAAEAKVLLGQAYEMEGRKLTRADLGMIQAGIKLWQSRVDALNPAPAPIRPRGRVRGGSYRMR